MLKTTFIILISVTLFSSEIFSQANSILFRFNANHDFSQNISSTINVNNVEFQKYIDSIEATARNIGGWGYYAPIYSVFSGNYSYLESTENVRVSFAGDHKLSGEVWFKTNTSDASIFSWNDSTQLHGIDLYLSEGNINLERRFRDTTILLKSKSVLKLGKWYHLIWTLDVVKKNVTIEFYLNNMLDVSKVFTLNTDIGFAIVNSKVLIGKSSYKPELHFFNGVISAINFKSYIPQNEYLTTNVPFDGSEYFGVPTYHNYNIGTMNEEVDQIITSNPTPIMESAIVPYMDDDFIPQGLTNSYEDRDNYYVNPMVYSSLYNKTVDGVTGNKKSIIVEMDPSNNYKVRRCFRLNGELQYRHNGGLAFYNNKIYVSSGSKIEMYNIPNYDSINSNKYVNIYSGGGSLFTVSSIASYVTYYNDSIWVGDYVETSNNGAIKGYPLDENGRVINTVAPKVYKMPNRTQGVAWVNIEGRDYLMISLSSGDGRTYIYRVERKDLSSVSAPTPEKVFIFPAGGEDLSFDKDKNLFTQSESGAKYFQKRATSPWGTFYPFIYKISYETLFGDIVSVDDEKTFQIPSEYKLFNNYPNPFNPSTTIKYSIPIASEYLTSSQNVTLRVYDTLGREVATLVNEEQVPGNYKVNFVANNLTSGVYFYKLQSGDFIASKKMVLLK